MPRPTSSTTVQRPDLAAMVMEFDLEGAGFIGTQVLPYFDVEEQSADYPVIPVEALLKLPDTARRPRGTYNRGDWEFELDNYACLENGWEEPVDDVEAKLYARYFDAEEVAAIRAWQIVMRGQEKRIADMVFNSSNFTAHSLTHEWDDATNAVPITDVKAGKIAIRQATGLKPNTLIIAYSTFLDLGLNSQIVDRVKYTIPDVKRGEISREMLAMAFGVDQVLVGGAVYDSAKKGQSKSVADLWSNEYAMLCCVAGGKDIRTPCIGRTFRWTKEVAQNALVESYYQEEIRSNIIRTRQYTDEELIITDAAYLMDNVTT